MKHVTDKDVAELWDALVPDSATAYLQLYFTKDVQVKFASALLEKFGGLTKAEVRESERSAFMSAAQSLWFRKADGAGIVEWEENYLPRCLEACNSLYPTIPVFEQGVTLSDGTTWYRAAFEPNNPKRPVCFTRDDYEKCAAFLKETDPCP